MDDAVQLQLEAYNARDLEAFLHCYAADVVIARVDGSALMTGHEEMRVQYGALFNRPGVLHVDVVGRLRAGPWTVDEEHVVSGDLRMNVLVAYEVVDGVIARAVMLT